MHAEEKIGHRRDEPTDADVSKGRTQACMSWNSNGINGVQAPILVTGVNVSQQPAPTPRNRDKCMSQRQLPA